MARYGMESGDRGRLEFESTGNGTVQGFFIPTDTPEPDSAASRRLAKKVRILDADPASDTLTIHPIDTRSWKPSFLGPKYKQVETLIVPMNVSSSPDVQDMLEELPSGFTKDYEYGLGIPTEFNAIIDFVEEHTKCSIIDFAPSDRPTLDGAVFHLPLPRFETLRKALTSITGRGTSAARRVKEVHVHNDFGPELGLDPRPLTFGRHDTSRWMTRIAAGEDPLTSEEEAALHELVVGGAAKIGSSQPAGIARLQRDINLVNLEQLIASYEDAMAAAHGENWWQRFFEENVFALQLLFGGPMAFVDSQVPIGEGTSAFKGKKIADYLLKNTITGNASLVEIKRPDTKILLKRAYRTGVFGIQASISQAVTQVLDQALQLTRHERDTKTRTSDTSWVSNAPRCFVIAGHSEELASEEQKKSFDLYRNQLSSVHVITYDELLAQMKTLRDFLADEGADITA